MASRYSFSSAPTGLDHAAEITHGAGANGARIMQIMSGGEWSAQLIGAMCMDDLEVLDAIMTKTSTDSQFIENAQASGARLESRSIFRRL